MWSNDLNAALQFVSFVFSLASVVFRKQVIQPVEVLLRVEIVQQLSHADESHQLDAENSSIFSKLRDRHIISSNNTDNELKIVKVSW